MPWNQDSGKAIGFPDGMSVVPLPYRVLALIQERNYLFQYPLERLSGEIKDAGFRCDMCGNCCTQAVNPHIFLLDRDKAALTQIDPESFEPVPDPEFCDQDGILYTSGYALKMRGEDPHACWFLEKNRCLIYDRRCSICRIYPYTLRRIRDSEGRFRWRRVSRPGKHGHCHDEIPEEECRTLALAVKEYENAFLTQQISFLETIQEYFTKHSLVHDHSRYLEGLSLISRGSPVTITVYDAGELVEHPGYVKGGK